MLNISKTIIKIGLVILLCGICGIGIFTYYTGNKKNDRSREPSTINEPKAEQVMSEPVLSDKELKRQIGQMLLIGFRGTEITENSYIVRAIKDLNIGGVILFDYDAPSKSFPRNIVSPKQTKNLITNLKKFSDTPLFIAIDAEGGKVNRLKEKYGFISVPSHQELGEKNNPEETKKISAALARQLSDLGFNVNLAPVVDLNLNPDNPIIGGIGRSFSNEPDKVIEQAVSFIDGHREQGIITAIKHFPGHGSSRNDSHLKMADVTDTYQNEELAPFEKIIEQKKADMVMTAHIVNKNIDPEHPATLSPLFIQSILREKLGFDGVVVSDDMQMDAVIEHYSFEQAIIRAVNAGCDLLIISNNCKIYDEQAPYKVRDIIFNAVKQGKISRQTITESYSRIQNLKTKSNI